MDLQPPEEIDDDREHNADDDHGDDRKIKSAVFSFDPDITGQPAHPTEGVAKEKYNDADDDDHQSRNDDIFSGLLIHLDQGS